MSAINKMLKMTIVVHILSLWTTSDAKIKCQKVRVPFCRDLNYYNLTTLPDNVTQDQLKDEISQIAHHIIHQNENRCQYARAFLCLSYLPICYQHNPYQNFRINPCRELCLKAKSDCDVWNSLPNNPRFNCSLYVSNKNGFACFPPPATTHDKPDTTKVISPDTSMMATSSFRDAMHNTSHKVCNRCHHYGYDRRSQTCRLYCCSEGLFSMNDKNKMTLYMKILASLTFTFTLITILTSIIRPQRFKYPERILIYISLCYNIYSLAYLIRVFLRYDTVACEKLYTGNDTITTGRLPAHYTVNDLPCKFFCPHHRFSNRQVSKCDYADTFDTSSNTSFLIVESISHQPCTIIFIMLYYFDLAASIWLVILTLLWYLSAKKKWCSEIISSYAIYCHIVSWAIPALLVIILIIWRKVGADELTGLCFISSHQFSQKGFYMLGFVVLPHSLCIILSTGFMTIFYISTREIKTQLAQHVNTQASVVKLNRFRYRVCVFFILYLISTAIVLACYYYEYIRGSYWQLWHQNRAKSSVLPCSHKKRQEYGHKPPNARMSVFVIKLLAQLLRGIIVSFWVASRKTINEWKETLCSVNCYSRFQLY